MSTGLRLTAPPAHSLATDRLDEGSLEFRKGQRIKNQLFMGRAELGTSPSAASRGRPFQATGKGVELRGRCIIFILVDEHHLVDAEALAPNALYNAVVEISLRSLSRSRRRETLNAPHLRKQTIGTRGRAPLNRATCACNADSHDSGCGAARQRRKLTILR